MPSIAKQRRVNRSKVLVKRTQRYGGNPKLKPFNLLCGKLKSNNNLLAKALSIQKQENQLLFSEKVELTSQLQALSLACNKRDMMLANIQNNAKEMLSMLVTMTNHVTNTIVGCQQFSQKSDSKTMQPSADSAIRRESTRRLSTKSPARGVVKPMVSGHPITKPTINLRRVNMQRINDLIDLSIIDEGSPINTSQSHTASFTSASRVGYEGERRRRLPERIPVAYVGADDDAVGTLGRQEPRLSGRFSGRLSNSSARKRSGDALMTQMRSPSVSLCDVSKLLHNSQTINVRMLQDSRGSGDLNGSFNGLSNTIQNSVQHDSGGDTSTLDIDPQESEGARKNVQRTRRSPPAPKGVTPEKSTKTLNKTNTDLEIDPLEGPSWLLNNPVAVPQLENAEEEEQTAEIFHRKRTVHKLDSSHSEAELGNDPNDDSMEFTECVNTRPKQLNNAVQSTANNLPSNLPNRFVPTEIVGITPFNACDSDDPLNVSESADEQCTNLGMNRSSEFITDRRQRYIPDDDDDDDTIMLQLSRGTKPAKFDINELRLPVLNCPPVAPQDLNDSQPEVTTTIQIIPQNCAPPNLLHDDIEDRVSNFCGLQLPKIDDGPKPKKAKRVANKKQPRKYVKFYETDSSDSDCIFGSETDKKTKKPKKHTNVKDPSSAKVVLQKLNDTQMKIRATSPDQSLTDKTQDFDATYQRTSVARSSDLLTDSNSSTQSAGEKQRPRRQKAPTNLKEPSLGKYVKDLRV